MLLTILFALVMMAGLFLMLLLGVGFIQDSVDMHAVLI